MLGWQVYSKNKIEWLARRLFSHYLPQAARQGRRLFGARWRALPNFIIVGAQKAGTSSLYEYLVQHPQVLSASVKEIHYFDVRYAKGVTWYRSHFSLVATMKEKGRVTGEASLYYLFHPHAAEHIKVTVPHAKLIVLLRDPVARAISHYFHQVRMKNEMLPMEQAFREEERRLEVEEQKMLNDPLYHSASYQRFSYKKRGVYVNQLRVYFELFPSEQILVLKSEDLFLRPESVLQETFSFLGVDTALTPRNLDLAKRNVGGVRQKNSRCHLPLSAGLFCSAQRTALCLSRT